MTGANHQQTAKVFILIFIVLGAVVFGFWQTARQRTHQQTTQVAVPEKKGPMAVLAFSDGAIMKVSVGSATVSAEVAQSDAKRGLGLGKRSSLAEGTGMLFIFDKPGTYRFWNRDMNFAIDMVWILNGTVVDTYQHLPDYATSKDFIVTPASPVDHVLEVPDGFIKENTIKKGDAVIYEPEKN